MALEDDIALLAGVPILATMERDALRLLAFSADSRVLRAGDVLFRKGEPADGGYVVVRGAIAMVEDEAQTADAVVGPGFLIGELALMSETVRPATAIAREPTTVMRLSRYLFRRTLDEYPHVAQKLAAELRSRVTGLSDELAGVKKKLDRIGK